MDRGRGLGVLSRAARPSRGAPPLWLAQPSSVHFPLLVLTPRPASLCFCFTLPGSRASSSFLLPLARPQKAGSASALAEWSVNTSPQLLWDSAYPLPGWAPPSCRQHPGQPHWVPTSPWLMPVGFHPALVWSRRSFNTIRLEILENNLYQGSSGTMDSLWFCLLVC